MIKKELLKTQLQQCFNALPLPDVTQKFVMELCTLVFEISDQRQQCLDVVQQQTDLMKRQQELIESQKERILFLESEQNENNPC